MQEPDVPDSKVLEAILASLRLWLLDVAAALIELFGPRGRIRRRIARTLRANLRSAEYDAKRALFLLAIGRLPPHEGKSRCVHALGYALRRRHGSDFRRLTHGVFNARPLELHARIARFRDMLDNVEAWTARVLKRLLRGFNSDPRILAAPPVARAFVAPTHARAAADSS